MACSVPRSPSRDSVPDASTVGRLPPSRASRLLAFSNEAHTTVDLPASGSLVLGRGRDADVRIDHTSVSRAHARLHLGVPLRVEDLGSANGTRVDGRPVAIGKPADVMVGAVVELGDVRVVAAGDTREGAEERMARVRDLVQRFAPSEVSIIVVGETGAGKELLAEDVHRRSRRAAGPLLRLNCAALTASLLESELFGHERGAFTGATQAKVGLLEAAQGGTVLLDEVGELPLAVQAKLLRVLENREVLRVGAIQTRPIDVRFVCATHRDLDVMVVLGQFRQDLLFRLNGVTISLPPLRARVAEIPVLGQAFLAEACQRAGKASMTISSEACLLLASYRWPGNVRELKNVIERAVLLADSDVIGVQHLMFGRGDFDGAGASTPRPASVPEVLAFGSGAAGIAHGGEDERRRILDALAQSGGNQKEAARRLGLSPRMLAYRIDKLGLPRPRKKGS
jgi:two-component system, NtrC family, response regulator AtoC